MHGHLEAFLTGVIVGEIYVLAGECSLGAYIVGIHALPAAGQRATVENALDAVVVGIAEDIFIESHRLLLVATEEVDLDSFNPDTLHPRHVLLAFDGVIHHASRSLWSIILGAVAVVPQHELHILRLGICSEFLDAVVADLRVPEGIDEAVFKAHFYREIYHLHLNVVGGGTVLPDEPAPRVAAGLIFLGGFVERFHDIELHGGLNDGSQRVADGDGAPRGESG